MPAAARTIGRAFAVVLVLALGLLSTASAVPSICVPTFGAAVIICDDDDHATSDGGETAVTFGTQAFPYYVTTYTGATQLAVDNNGWVALGTDATSDNPPSAAELLTAVPPIIAPYWADLIASPAAPAENGDVF